MGESGNNVFVIYNFAPKWGSVTAPWQSTWAISFSFTRSTRDWPPGSQLCLLLCSWSIWQLLKEVLCNTHPAIGVPLSAGARDVSALCDSSSGLHTSAQGSAVLLSKSSRGWGQPGPGHKVLARTKPKRTALRQEKQPPFGWCLCLGGFCWCSCQDFEEGVHSFQSKPKEAPELGSKGGFAFTAEAKALSGIANWAMWHTNPAMPQLTQKQAEDAAGLSWDAAMQVCEPDYPFVTQTRLPKSSTAFDHLVN